jgi:protein-tyrosine phosphatase
MFMISSCGNASQKNEHKKNEMDTTQRLLPIEGAYNVRDLGGYKTADGKHVKWNKVIRSGDLNHLTNKDLDYFAILGIVSYVDFRDIAEIRSAQDRRPVTLKNYHELNISPGNTSDLQDFANTDLSHYMVEINEMLVRDFQETYAEFFQILMNEENVPLLFHCTAGKDRTGFAAALFLSSLGVDRETVMYDYLLSAKYVKKKYAPIVERYPSLEPALTVKREYLQAAFDVIDHEFGGMDNYLVNHLRINLHKMRALYTE